PRVRPPGGRPAEGDYEPVQVAFDDRGQRLLLFTEGRMLAWDLAPDERPADDLVLLAELLSGRRIDDSEALTPLPPKALAAAWQALRTRYPTGLGLGTLSHEALLAWHQGQAEQCERDEDWSAAVFHRGRLIDADPRSATLRKARGRGYVR